ncbi:MAG: cyclic nucleotide-binding domain-containing protein [Granulosicoccus sp.]
MQSIAPEMWENLEPHISFQKLAAGETLFKAGRESQALYLVVEGELELYVQVAEDNQPFYLNSRFKGDTAGDFAVLNGGAHLVNAVAARKTKIAQFPRFAFDRLTDIDSQILKHVYDVAAELSRLVALAAAYRQLFGPVSHATLLALLDKTAVRHFHSGQTLIKDGDATEGLFIIISGKLVVQNVRLDGTTHHIAEVQAPETVGELALLADTRSSATVVAARESTVALLDRAAFKSLILPDADMLLCLSRLVVRRHIANVRQENQTTSDRNFVILPLDSRLPMRRFVHQLKRAMLDVGTTLTLDSRHFETQYGRRGVSQTPFDDPFNSAIAEWLDDKENRAESIIYVADRQWNAWTRRCINRADRLVLLANANSANDASPREIERQISQLFENSPVRPKIDLVLLHQSDTVAPQGTAAWLRPRILDAYHHIRLDDKKHFGRLARRLRNVARGIVFSGGGARGYAHLGVQQLIEEESIPIDYIGGSSMGGLLGASMAMGLSSKEILDLSTIFANRKALYDYTLPLASLMKSVKLTNFCKRVYGETRIEDLWVPYFCMSSNLADGREILHDQGPLWKVVRSTISIPGLFSPVPTVNGDLLIDGAVLNTFPVDVMQQKLDGKGYIIGVNVSQIPEQFNYYDFGPSLSGWRVFLSRINPFEQRIAIPRIAETLLRSTDIKSIDRLNEARKSLDILVEPNVRSIALLDFKSYESISEIGYKEAKTVFSRAGLIGESTTAAT